jgi:hypothetical protein
VGGYVPTHRFPGGIPVVGGGGGGGGLLFPGVRDDAQLVLGTGTRHMCEEAAHIILKLSTLHEIM